MKNGKGKVPTLLLVGMVSFLVAACAGVSMKGYTGPDLPASQTAAIIPGSLADIVSCDGAKLTGFQANVNVLPGSHTIGVAFAWRDDGGNIAYSSGAIGSVTFVAEAGHRYQVYAYMDYSSDSWMAVVADMGSHAQIARSKALHMDVFLRPRGDVPG